MEFKYVTFCANWCYTANWQKCLQAEASNKHAFITITSVQSTQMSNNPKPNQHAAAQRGFVMKFPRFGGERLNKRFSISVVTDVMKGATGSKHFRNKVEVPSLSSFFFFVISSKLQMLHHLTTSSRQNILIRNRKSCPDLHVHGADGCVHKL